MTESLLENIARSDAAAVSQVLDRMDLTGEAAWQTHLSLFPIVHRVLNPPYINPHLPKMYAVLRDFLPYMEDGMAPLIRLEATEYAKRDKLNVMPRPSKTGDSVSFDDITSAIASRETGTAAALMYSFVMENDVGEFARQLLLLGSGYLDKTLGHSVSCTAFTLLELSERPDEDPWPVMSLLADYFCKGQFRTMPELSPSPGTNGEALMKATSGEGIVNLHHTITRYAIERSRHFLTEVEYAHMLAKWGAFMGDKEAQENPVITGDRLDYEQFRECVRSGDQPRALTAAMKMLVPAQGPPVSIEPGRYLIRAVCDLYQGDYDPHFLTGLGATLWVAENNRHRPDIVSNALRQYLNYFMTSRS